MSLGLMRSIDSIYDLERTKIPNKDDTMRLRAILWNMNKIADILNLVHNSQAFEKYQVKYLKMLNF